MNERRKLSSEEWSMLVDKFNSSGLSQRKFADQENLVKSQLSYYIMKSRESNNLARKSFIELPSATSNLGQGVVAELGGCGFTMFGFFY